MPAGALYKMQKYFKVTLNIFEISLGSEINNLGWSMQTSFHQSPHGMFWLKQENKASASLFWSFYEKSLQGLAAFTLLSLVRSENKSLSDIVLSILPICKVINF